MICAVCINWFILADFSNPRATGFRPIYLPREAVALAVLKAEVGHFAVRDVHPRLSHVVFGLARAALPAVGDDFRDGADVRPPIGLVFIVVVSIGVPGPNLKIGGGTEGRGATD